MEAYLREHDTLPHLHRDLGEMFPQAVASNEETETEDVAPCGFEQRGKSLANKAAQ